MVGRSKDITGPYLDKDGVRMDEGVASRVLEGNEDWSSMGQNADNKFDGTDYLISIAYDADDEGKPKLVIREMSWNENDWLMIFW